MKYLYEFKTDERPSFNWGEEISIGYVRGKVIETYYSHVAKLGYITLSSDQPPETLPANFQPYFCGIA